MTPPPLGLYVHMPWCVRKCPYCDFNSHQLRGAVPDSAYFDALLRDFDAQLPSLAGRAIESVFFGGGTPSLFHPEEFDRLLCALRRRIAFADDVEITLEANPGTVERGRFAGYRDAGINRVSLGAQSFSPGALEALGRIHSAEDTHRAVAELRDAGICNFNLDLMFALPGQSSEEALEDVLAACALEPAHISYYQLTLEPGTVFFARPPALPDEESAWRIQCAGQQALAQAGYVQYEVSAYAREGARCRHNLNYWRFGDYAGIGAGAHGKLTLAAPGQIVRTAKPKQPREYQERLRSSEPVEWPLAAIDPKDLPFEYMLNALRLNDGFTMAEFRQRTGLDDASVDTALRRAEGRGLLARAPEGWRPTELGLRFLNDLQASFLV